ncbi:MAG: ATP-binding protein, partial [Candidatus Gygaella obscura]|nr:ATP-binding protein [Candidatus Gygaella obscura]
MLNEKVNAQPKEEFKSKFNLWIKVAALIVLCVFIPEQVAWATHFNPIAFLQNAGIYAPSLSDLNTLDIPLTVKNILKDIEGKNINAIKLKDDLVLEFDKPIDLSSESIEQIYEWLKGKPCGSKALFEFLNYKEKPVIKDDIAVRALTVDILEGITKPVGNPKVIENSLYALQRTAEFFDINMVAIKIDKDRLIEIAKNPFIAHLSYSHFIFISRIEDEKVYYITDEKEEFILKDKFLEDFSGYCLVELANFKDLSLIITDAQAKKIMGAYEDTMTDYGFDAESIPVGGYADFSEDGSMATVYDSSGSYQDSWSSSSGYSVPSTPTVNYNYDVPTNYAPAVNTNSAVNVYDSISMPKISGGYWEKADGYYKSDLPSGGRMTLDLDKKQGAFISSEGAWVGNYNFNNINSTISPIEIKPGYEGQFSLYTPHTGQTIEIKRGYEGFKTANVMKNRASFGADRFSTGVASDSTAFDAIKIAAFNQSPNIEILADGKVQGLYTASSDLSNGTGYVAQDVKAGIYDTGAVITDSSAWSHTPKFFDVKVGPVTEGNVTYKFDADKPFKIKEFSVDSLGQETKPTAEYSGFRGIIESSIKASSLPAVTAGFEGVILDNQLIGKALPYSYTSNVNIDNKVYISALGSQKGNTPGGFPTDTFGSTSARITNPGNITSVLSLNLENVSDQVVVVNKPILPVGTQLRATTAVQPGDVGDVHRHSYETTKFLFEADNRIHTDSLVDFTGKRIDVNAQEFIGRADIDIYQGKGVIEGLVEARANIGELLISKDKWQVSAGISQVEQGSSLRSGIAADERTTPITKVWSNSQGQWGFVATPKDATGIDAIVHDKVVLTANVPEAKELTYRAERTDSLVYKGIRLGDGQQPLNVEGTNKSGNLLFGKESQLHLAVTTDQDGSNLRFTSLAGVPGTSFNLPSQITLGNTQYTNLSSVDITLNKDSILTPVYEAKSGEQAIAKSIKFYSDLDGVEASKAYITAGKTVDIVNGRTKDFQYTSALRLDENKNSWDLAFDKFNTKGYLASGANLEEQAPITGFKKRGDTFSIVAQPQDKIGNRIIETPTVLKQYLFKTKTDSITDDASKYTGIKLQDNEQTINITSTTKDGNFVLGKGTNLELLYSTSGDKKEFLSMSGAPGTTFNLSNNVNIESSLNNIASIQITTNENGIITPVYSKRSIVSAVKSEDALGPGFLYDKDKATLRVTTADYAAIGPVDIDNPDKIFITYRDGRRPTDLSQFKIDTFILPKFDKDIQETDAQGNRIFGQFSKVGLQSEKGNGQFLGTSAYDPSFRTLTYNINGHEGIVGSDAIGIGESITLLSLDKNNQYSSIASLTKNPDAIIFSGKDAKGESVLQVDYTSMTDGGVLGEKINFAGEDLVSKTTFMINNTQQDFRLSNLKYITMGKGDSTRQVLSEADFVCHKTVDGETHVNRMGDGKMYNPPEKGRLYKFYRDDGTLLREEYKVNSRLVFKGGLGDYGVHTRVLTYDGHGKKAVTEKSVSENRIETTNYRYNSDGTIADGSAKFIKERNTYDESDSPLTDMAISAARVYSQGYVDSMVNLGSKTAPRSNIKTDWKTRTLIFKDDKFVDIYAEALLDAYDEAEAEAKSTVSNILISAVRVLNPGYVDAVRVSNPGYLDIDINKVTTEAAQGKYDAIFSKGLPSLLVDAITPEVGATFIGAGRDVATMELYFNRQQARGLISETETFEDYYFKDAFIDNTVFAAINTGMAAVFGTVSGVTNILSKMGFDFSEVSSQQSDIAQLIRTTAGAQMNEMETYLRTKDPSGTWGAAAWFGINFAHMYPQLVTHTILLDIGAQFIERGPSAGKDLAAIVPQTIADLTSGDIYTAGGQLGTVASFGAPTAITNAMAKATFAEKAMKRTTSKGSVITNIPGRLGGTTAVFTGAWVLSEVGDYVGAKIDKLTGTSIALDADTTTGFFQENLAGLGGYAGLFGGPRLVKKTAPVVLQKVAQKAFEAKAVYNYARKVQGKNVLSSSLMVGKEVVVKPIIETSLQIKEDTAGRLTKIKSSPSKLGVSTEIRTGLVNRPGVNIGETITSLNKNLKEIENTKDSAKIDVAARSKNLGYSDIENITQLRTTIERDITALKSVQKAAGRIPVGKSARTLSYKDGQTVYLKNPGFSTPRVSFKMNSTFKDLFTARPTERAIAEFDISLNSMQNLGELNNFANKLEDAGKNVIIKDISKKPIIATDAFKRDALTKIDSRMQKLAYSQLKSLADTEKVVNRIASRKITSEELAGLTGIKDSKIQNHFYSQAERIAEDFRVRRKRLRTNLESSRNEANQKVKNSDISPLGRDIANKELQLSNLRLENLEQEAKGQTPDLLAVERITRQIESDSVQLQKNEVASKYQPRIQELESRLMKTQPGKKSIQRQIDALRTDLKIEQDAVDIGYVNNPSIAESNAVARLLKHVSERELDNALTQIDQMADPNTGIVTVRNNLFGGFKKQTFSAVRIKEFLSEHVRLKEQRDIFKLREDMLHKAIKNLEDKKVTNVDALNLSIRGETHRKVLLDTANRAKENILIKKKGEYLVKITEGKTSKLPNGVLSEFNKAGETIREYFAEDSGKKIEKLNKGNIELSKGLLEFFKKEKLSVFEAFSYAEFMMDNMKNSKGEKIFYDAEKKTEQLKMIALFTAGKTVHLDTSRGKSAAFVIELGMRKLYQPESKGVLLVRSNDVNATMGGKGEINHKALARNFGLTLKNGNEFIKDGSKLINVLKNGENLVVFDHDTFSHLYNRTENGGAIINALKARDTMRFDEFHLNLTERSSFVVSDNTRGISDKEIARQSELYDQISNLLDSEKIDVETLKERAKQAKKPSIYNNESTEYTALNKAANRILTEKLNKDGKHYTTEEINTALWAFLYGKKGVNCDIVGGKVVPSNGVVAQPGKIFNSAKEAISLAIKLEKEGYFVDFSKLESSKTRIQSTFTEILQTNPGGSILGASASLDKAKLLHDAYLGEGRVASIKSKGNSKKPEYKSIRDGELDSIIEWIKNSGDIAVLVAVKDPKLRERLISRIREDPVLGGRLKEIHGLTTQDVIGKYARDMASEKSIVVTGEQGMVAVDYKSHINLVIADAHNYTAELLRQTRGRTGRNLGDQTRQVIFGDPEKMLKRLDVIRENNPYARFKVDISKTRLEGLDVKDLIETNSEVLGQIEVSRSLVFTLRESAWSKLVLQPLKYMMIKAESYGNHASAKILGEKYRELLDNKEKEVDLLIGDKQKTAEEVTEQTIRNIASIAEETFRSLKGELRPTWRSNASVFEKTIAVYKSLKARFLLDGITKKELTNKLKELEAIDKYEKIKPNENMSFADTLDLADYISAAKRGFFAKEILPQDISAQDIVKQRAKTLQVLFSKEKSQTVSSEIEARIAEGGKTKELLIDTANIIKKNLPIYKVVARSFIAQRAMPFLQQMFEDDKITTEAEIANAISEKVSSIAKGLKDKKAPHIAISGENRIIGFFKELGTSVSTGFITKPQKQELLYTALGLDSYSVYNLLEAYSAFDNFGLGNSMQQAPMHNLVESLFSYHRPEKALRDIVLDNIDKIDSEWDRFEVRTIIESVKSQPVLLNSFFDIAEQVRNNLDKARESALAGTNSLWLGMDMAQASRTSSIPYAKVLTAADFRIGSGSSLDSMLELYKLVRDRFQHDELFRELSIYDINFNLARRIAESDAVVKSTDNEFNTIIKGIAAEQTYFSQTGIGKGINKLTGKITKWAEIHENQDLTALDKQLLTYLAAGSSVDRYDYQTMVFVTDALKQANDKLYPSLSVRDLYENIELSRLTEYLAKNATSAPVKKVAKDIIKFNVGQGKLDSDAQKNIQVNIAKAKVLQEQLQASDITEESRKQVIAELGALSQDTTALINSVAVEDLSKQQVLIDDLVTKVSKYDISSPRQFVRNVLGGYEANSVTATKIKVDQDGVTVERSVSDFALMQEVTSSDGSKWRVLQDSIDEQNNIFVKIIETEAIQSAEISSDVASETTKASQPSVVLEDTQDTIVAESAFTPAQEPIDLINGIQSKADSQKEPPKVAGTRDESKQDLPILSIDEAAIYVDSSGKEHFIKIIDNDIAIRGGYIVQDLNTNAQFGPINPVNITKSSTTPIEQAKEPSYSRIRVVFDALKAIIPFRSSSKAGSGIGTGSSAAGIGVGKGALVNTQSEEQEVPVNKPDPLPQPGNTQTITPNFAPLQFIGTNLSILFSALGGVIAPNAYAGYADTDPKDRAATKALSLFKDSPRIVAAGVCATPGREDNKSVNIHENNFVLAIISKFLRFFRSLSERNVNKGNAKSVGSKNKATEENATEVGEASDSKQTTNKDKDAKADAKAAEKSDKNSLKEEKVAQSSPKASEQTVGLRGANRVYSQEDEINSINESNNQETRAPPVVLTYFVSPYRTHTQKVHKQIIDQKLSLLKQVNGLPQEHPVRVYYFNIPSILLSLKGNQLDSDLLEAYTRALFMQAGINYAAMEIFTDFDMTGYYESTTGEKVLKNYLFGRTYPTHKILTNSSYRFEEVLSNGFYPKALSEQERKDLYVSLVMNNSRHEAGHLAGINGSHNFFDHCHDYACAMKYTPAIWDLMEVKTEYCFSCKTEIEFNAYKPEMEALLNQMVEQSREEASTDGNDNGDNRFKRFLTSRIASPGTLTRVRETLNKFKEGLFTNKQRKEGAPCLQKTRSITSSLTILLSTAISRLSLQLLEKFRRAEPKSSYSEKTISTLEITQEIPGKNYKVPLQMTSRIDSSKQDKTISPSTSLTKTTTKDRTAVREELIRLIANEVVIRKILHDLNNPLTAVKGWVKMLKEKLSEKDAELMQALNTVDVITIKVAGYHRLVNDRATLMKKLQAEIKTEKRDISKEQCFNQAFDTIVTEDTLDEFNKVYVTEKELARDIAGVRNELIAINSSQFDAEAARDTKIIIDSLSQVIAGVTKLAEAKMGKLSRFEFSTFEISNVLGTVYAVTNKYFSKKGINITYENNIGQVLIYSDAFALRAGFGELINNADKYAWNGNENSEKTVKIIVTRNGRFITIVFEDNGRGIPEDALDSIFEEYYRAEPDMAEGTGLGLASLKELVELSKGTIRVENNNGARFTVRLPVQSDNGNLSRRTFLKAAVLALVVKDVNVLYANERPAILAKSLDAQATWYLDRFAPKNYSQIDTLKEILYMVIILAPRYWEYIVTNEIPIMLVGSEYFTEHADGFITAAATQKFSGYFGSKYVILLPINGISIENASNLTQYIVHETQHIMDYKAGYKDDTLEGSLELERRAFEAVSEVFNIENDFYEYQEAFIRGYSETKNPQTTAQWLKYLAARSPIVLLAGAAAYVAYKMLKGDAKDSGGVIKANSSVKITEYRFSELQPTFVMLPDTSKLVKRDEQVTAVDTIDARVVSMDNAGKDSVKFDSWIPNPIVKFVSKKLSSIISEDMLKTQGLSRIYVKLSSTDKIWFNTLIAKRDRTSIGFNRFGTRKRQILLGKLSKITHKPSEYWSNNQSTGKLMSDAQLMAIYIEKSFKITPKEIRDALESRTKRISLEIMFYDNSGKILSEAVIFSVKRADWRIKGVGGISRRRSSTDPAIVTLDNGNKVVNLSEADIRSILKKTIFETKHIKNGIHSNVFIKEDLPFVIVDTHENHLDTIDKYNEINIRAIRNLRIIPEFVVMDKSLKLNMVTVNPSGKAKYTHTINKAVIREKVTLADDKITQLVKEGKINEAIALLYRIKDTGLALEGQRLFDYSYNLLMNYGITGDDRVVMFDIGDLLIDRVETARALDIRIKRAQEFTRFLDVRLHKDYLNILYQLETSRYIKDNGDRKLTRRDFIKLLALSVLLPREVMAFSKIDTDVNLDISLQGGLNISDNNNWLKGQYKALSGLIASYEGIDITDGSYNKSYTYDLALFIMDAVNHPEDFKGIQLGSLPLKLLARMIAARGSWYESYDIESGRPADKQRLVGPNAFMGLAMLHYYKNSSLPNRFLALVQAMAIGVWITGSEMLPNSWIKTVVTLINELIRIITGEVGQIQQFGFQNMDESNPRVYGSVTFGLNDIGEKFENASIEHNIAALALLYNIGKITGQSFFTERAKLIANWLTRDESFMFNGEYFMAGYRNEHEIDPTLYLDTQILTNLVLKTTEEIIETDISLYNNLELVRNTFEQQVDYFKDSSEFELKGFPFRLEQMTSALSSIWCEGTSQFEVANKAVNNAQPIYIDTLETLQTQAGGVLSAIGPRQYGWPVNLRVPHVATTAWAVFAKTGFNPYGLGYIDSQDNGNNHAVLVVDDQEAMRVIIRDNLEMRIPDVKVIIAKDGEQALEILRSIPIAVVITDNKMPKMDAKALCAAMSKEEQLKAIPVVLMTGFDLSVIDYNDYSGMVKKAFTKSGNMFEEAAQATQEILANNKDNGNSYLDYAKQAGLNKAGPLSIIEAVKAVATVVLSAAAGYLILTSSFVISVSAITGLVGFVVIAAIYHRYIGSILYTKAGITINQAIKKYAANLKAKDIIRFSTYIKNSLKKIIAQDQASALTPMKWLMKIPGLGKVISALGNNPATAWAIKLLGTVLDVLTTMILYTFFLKHVMVSISLYNARDSIRIEEKQAKLIIEEALRRVEEDNKSTKNKVISALKSVITLGFAQDYSDNAIIALSENSSGKVKNIFTKIAVAFYVLNSSFLSLLRQRLVIRIASVYVAAYLLGLLPMAAKAIIHAPLLVIPLPFGITPLIATLSLIISCFIVVAFLNMPNIYNNLKANFKQHKFKEAVKRSVKTNAPSLALQTVSMMLVPAEIEAALKWTDGMPILGESVKFMEEFVYGANGTQGLGEKVLTGVEGEIYTFTGVDLNKDLFNAISNNNPLFDSPTYKENHEADMRYTMRNLEKVNYTQGTINKMLIPFEGIYDRSKDLAKLVLEPREACAQEVDPYSSEYLIARAWDAYNNNDLSAALEYAKELIGIHEGQEANDYVRNDVATAYYMEGLIYIKQDKLTDARASLEYIIDNYPETSMYNEDLGEWVSLKEAAEDLIVSMDYGVDFGDYSAEYLIEKLFDSYNASDYSAAHIYADKIIEIFSDQAIEQMSVLSDYPATPEDTNGNGVIDEEEKSAFWANTWALNSVGS